MLFLYVCLCSLYNTIGHPHQVGGEHDHGYDDGSTGRGVNPFKERRHLPGDSAAGENIVMIVVHIDNVCPRLV